jgi:hypothetical protein
MCSQPIFQYRYPLKIYLPVPVSWIVAVVVSPVFMSNKSYLKLNFSLYRKQHTLYIKPVVNSLNMHVVFWCLFYVSSEEKVEQGIHLTGIFSCV